MNESIEETKSFYSTKDDLEVNVTFSSDRKKIAIELNIDLYNKFELIRILDVTGWTCDIKPGTIGDRKMIANTEYYNLEVAFEVVDQESFYKLMDIIKPLLCKKYDGFTHKASCVMTNKKVFYHGIEE